MEHVMIGEDCTCAECERVLWRGEPAYCGSPRSAACSSSCHGGFDCVALCESCFHRLLDGFLVAAPASVR